MLLKKYWLARKIQFEVGSEYLRDNIGAGCVLLPLSICGTSLLANFSQKEHFSRHQLCMYATLSITLATFGDRIKIGIILMFGACGQSDDMTWHELQDPTDNGQEQFLEHGAYDQSDEETCPVLIVLFNKKNLPIFLLFYQRIWNFSSQIFETKFSRNFGRKICNITYQKERVGEGVNEDFELSPKFIWFWRFPI